ncbi:MAG TPA: antibiotic biosynthesis monooxygenase family protein [Sphingobacteriaceae bacterium]
MIIRFVKMTFRPEHASEFENLFALTRPRITGFDGCHQVDLFTDSADRNVYFTVSHWDSEDHLNRYRSSDFFRETWSRVKPMFSARAEAWSLVRPGPEEPGNTTG